MEVGRTVRDLDARVGKLSILKKSKMIQFTMQKCKIETHPINIRIKSLPKKIGTLQY